MHNLGVIDQQNCRDTLLGPVSYLSSGFFYLPANVVTNRAVATFEVQFLYLEHQFNVADLH